MVANCSAKSQFRDLSLIQYNSRLFLRGKLLRSESNVVPSPSGEGYGEGLSAETREDLLLSVFFVATALTPAHLSKGEGG